MMVNGKRDVLDLRIFCNVREEAHEEIMGLVEGTGIRCPMVPTSGPYVLWVGRAVYYGPTAIRKILLGLAEEKSRRN